MTELKSLRAIGIAALCGVMFTGCDMLRQVGTSGDDDQVVTLADGRRVVVSGTRNADGSISPRTTKGSGETPTSSGKQDKEKSEKKKKDKKGKKKGERKLAPPQKSDSKKKDKQRKAVSTKRESVVTPEDSLALSGAVNNMSAAVGANAAADTLAASASSDRQIGGEWTIYSVNNTLVTGEERPYMSLDLAQNRFYGNNGCNYINGGLTVGPSGAISFTNMISTMKMCQDDRFQYLINLALDKVVSYWSRQSGPITFLDLKDKEGNILMILRRHNMDFINGAWQVKEMNGIPLLESRKLTITFDTGELKTHGNTGCNIFNGEMFIDPDKTNSLQLINLSTTRMACDRVDLETEMLLALEEVETAIRNADGSITLRSPEGKELLLLSPLDLRDKEAVE